MSMEKTLRAATAAEKLYAAKQSTQIACRCGALGVLRGDLEDVRPEGTWRNDLQDLAAPDFQKEYRAVLETLREQSDSEGVFRADGESFTYLVRCDAEDGVSIYPYRRDWLENHMRCAERGIRLIQPDPRKEFRIPDGDLVRIRTPDGRVLDRVCRYVDDCHLEVGRNLYHIYEFADRQEQNGNTVIPLRSSLPEKCYSFLAITNEIILIRKGGMGYTPIGVHPEGVTLQEGADALNDAMGVSKAQEAAMLAGTMFGWDAPAADPKNYDEQGHPLRPRQRSREAVR